MYAKEVKEENFWKNLKKPFFCLAPMSDVTDSAFRKILAKYSKTPENRGQVVFWTEFIAADGICNKLARKRLAHILEYSENERPIVAQVFGANPANMKIACQYISSLGFDGIDINMGCPDRSVIDQGAGAALIKTPALARKIIQAAHEGTVAAGQHLPISVKTRIGFNKDEIDTWLPELLKENISALTVHLRTKKEMSEVPAHWEYMKKIVKMVKDSGKDILVIGNGDVNNLAEARQKCEETGCDGVMIGRGVFGNPWIFNESANVVNLKDKIEALKEHIKIFNKLLMQPKDKHYDVMKKHFKAYINGFPPEAGRDGAKELREKLMATHSPEESLRILSVFQKSLK